MSLFSPDRKLNALRRRLFLQVGAGAATVVAGLGATRSEARATITAAGRRARANRRQGASSSCAVATCSAWIRGWAICRWPTFMSRAV